ncbi:MAG: 3-isopropylmalate dehydratase small subunit [Firmicutes bacterium]|nr:3-isopropylmalate dehydratase small subunit [Bacillota bacterium]
MTIHPKPIEGRAWRLGDNVDTGQLALAEYSAQGVAVYARHCLEHLRPEFAAEVRPGDLVVAGENFGSGSSRETAVLALKHLGVAAVVAASFARLFFRNAINLGLPVVECKEVARIADGDRVVVDPWRGQVDNLTRQESYPASALPEHLRELLEAGGLVPWLERRMRDSR